MQKIMYPVVVIFFFSRSSSSSVVVMFSLGMGWGSLFGLVSQKGSFSQVFSKFAKCKNKAGIARARVRACVRPCYLG